MRSISLGVSRETVPKPRRPWAPFINHDADLGIVKDLPSSPFDEFLVMRSITLHCDQQYASGSARDERRRASQSRRRHPTPS